MKGEKMNRKNEKKLEEIEKEINKLFNELLENSKTNIKSALLYILCNINHEKLQEWAWQEVQKRNSLAFPDLYQIENQVRNPRIRSEIIEKMIKEANLGQLCNIIKYKDPEVKKLAEEEFIKRFKETKNKEKFDNSVVYEGFVQIIHSALYKGDTKRARNALAMLGKLNPPREIYENLLKLPKLNHKILHFLPSTVRHFLQIKKMRNERTTQIIRELHQLVEGLNQNEQKAQEK